MIDSILASEDIADFNRPGGTDKQSIHSYGPVYEDLLARFQGKSVNLLEVGVQYGGSLLLWHQLLPKAYIVGVDVQNAVHPSIFERMDNARYSLIVDDAYSDATAAKIKTIMPTGIDVAIDDGPHTLASQVAFIKLYAPQLSENGIAIIEDVQDVGWLNSLREAVPEGMAGYSVDRRHVKGRYDDLMFVIARD